MISPLARRGGGHQSLKSGRKEAVWRVSTPEKNWMHSEPSLAQSRQSRQMGKTWLKSSTSALFSRSSWPFLSRARPV